MKTTVTLPMMGTGRGSGQGRSSSATNSPTVLGWKLFSRALSPRSVEVLNIMSGHTLRVNALYKNVKVLFICVYALVLSTAKINFLNVLCDVVCDCADDYLFLGGDFNCPEDYKLNRNHLEPPPASSARLRHLMETHELKDVWRGFNSKNKQYTWTHC